MNEWNIQGRARVCGACAQPFADGQLYHTLLYEERPGLRRLDVCESCWQRQFSQGARERKGFVSYWQGVYQSPPPKTEVIARETAETLLRKIIARNEPRYGPAAYILAAMLERKRVLKVREQLQREGRRVFVYEHPASGDVFTITDPNLQLHQLDSVQRDVAHLLEHGLPEGVGANPEEAGQAPDSPPMATSGVTGPPAPPIAG